MRFVLADTPKGEIAPLFNEVYSAVFTGNNRIALMGIRAIVDVALTDKLGDIDGFAQKLAKAKELQWITPAHNTVLQAGG